MIALEHVTCFKNSAAFTDTDKPVKQVDIWPICKYNI